MCVFSSDCHCLSVVVEGREGDVQTYLDFAVNVRELTVYFPVFFYMALRSLQRDPFSQEDTDCTKQRWMILTLYRRSADRFI